MVVTPKYQDKILVPGLRNCEGLTEKCSMADDPEACFLISNWKSMTREGYVESQLPIAHQQTHA